MQIRPTSALIVAFAALALACKGGRDEPTDDSSVSTDDSQSTDDSESTDDTSFGEQYDDEDPSLTLTIDGVEREWVQGNWSTSALSATADDGSGNGLSITIMVDGDLHYAGTYPVTFINYSSSPPQGTATSWVNASPEGVTVTVDGFYNREEMFGAVEGTESLGEGTPVSFEGGEIRGWPSF